MIFTFLSARFCLLCLEINSQAKNSLISFSTSQLFVFEFETEMKTEPLLHSAQRHQKFFSSGRDIARGFMAKQNSRKKFMEIFFVGSLSFEGVR